MTWDKTVDTSLSWTGTGWTKPRWFLDFSIYKNKNIIKCLREVVSKCRDGLSLEHRAEDDFLRVIIIPSGFIILDCDYIKLEGHLRSEFKGMVVIILRVP